MSKTIYIGGRLESKEKGNVVTGANAILDDTKGKKQNVINKETDDELARLEQSKQDNLNFDNAPTENSTNPVTSGGVYTAEKALSDAIEAILLLIPSAATALNKLVDTNTMNSSISTATATFRGTYNAVSDLGLTYQATHAQIEAALDALGLTADNNDFAFVQIPVSDQSQDIAKTERYKNNGTNWLYEYDLNTSGFTAAQWAAINSTITLALVQKLAALPTNAELLQALGLKQDVLTFDNAPTTDSNNPVKSGGIKNAIDTAVGDEAIARENADTALSGLIGDEKTRAEDVEGGLNTRLGTVEDSVSTIQGVIPSEATSSNKLVDSSSMITYIGTIIDNIDATFNVTSTDGHVTLAITQVNGVITSVQLTTSDIASAAALNLKASQADLTALAGRVTTLAGRVTTAEGNITSLTGRMTTAESDIDTLTDLYNALQQSAPQVIQPTDTWPVANPSTTVIYRVIDRVNTPPEYYSDYMWNGTSMVLMATYNNAVDTTPKKESANLITSGGVFANIGAFDISEYHKSGSTLATYADLTAALAAIPSDYQKGGMSIKFVQSSDNKYVQYRNMSRVFTTAEYDWQGVTNTVNADSNNLVNGAGIANAIARKGCFVDFSEGKYDVSDAIIFLKINQIWDANKIYTVQQYNPSTHSFAIYVKDGESFTAYAACNEGNATSHTGDVYTWIFGQSEIIIDFSQSSKSYGNGSVNFNNRIREICFINPNIPRIDNSLNEIRNTIFLGKSTAQYDNVCIPNKTLNTQFSPDFQSNNDFCSFIFKIKKGTTVILRNTTVPEGAKYLYVINDGGIISDRIEFVVGDISYTALTDVTVAFSLYKTCYCIVPEYYGMKGLSHQIDIFNIDIEPYKHLNKLLNTNGNLVDITGDFWMTFHKIPVIKGSTVKADFPNVEIGAGYPVIILYSLDGNVVSKIEYSEATRLNHLEMTASVDGYFSVISCTPAYSLDSNPSVILSPSFVTVNKLNYDFFSLITNNRERILELEDKNDYLFYNQGFESIYKFGIIGDSLSVGFMTNPVDNVQNSRNLRFSWGQILARKNGQECLNFGVAGASPWSWYNKSDQVDLCKNLMINPNMLCQCYIIGLGINTDAVYNIDTVGSLSDIDWNDKDNNANSWYGNYAKIIQLIRETAPQAVIFTLTRPAPREENTVNTMIREISNDSHLSSNVFLVDLASAKYNKYFEAIVGYYYEAHHTAAGYACCGEIIEKAISDVMLANATNAAIRSIGFIPYGNGTNP